MDYSTPELVAVVSGLTGAGIGAVAKSMSGNRRVDKVDAVAAISEAYKSVIHRLEKQLDAVEQQVVLLRADIQRKDEMLERLIERLATVAPVLPVAPVAPVLPVAPVYRVDRRDFAPVANPDAT